jgi:hypothetical protein
VSANPPIIENIASGRLKFMEYGESNREIINLLRYATNKTFQLDPALTWLVKEFANLLAPLIINFFNVLLATAYFLQKYKHAAVKPLLTIDNLDSSELENFRPASNLPFLSKLLERVVQVRLQS